MAGSIERVEAAAGKAGLPITVRRMSGSTRTAEEAAAQCRCEVAQIVKSLIFEGEATKGLYLFLLSGVNQLDLGKAAGMAGKAQSRADPRRIREETGFAIGGVSPIGHLVGLRTFADRGLMGFGEVFAAAGAHDAIFGAEPGALIAAAGAEVADLAG